MANCDSKPLNSSLYFASVSLITLAAIVFLFFNHGSGEHDTFQMAASIVHSVETGEIINNASYNPNLQFLFYYLFYPLALALDVDSNQILLIMNIMGAVCSFLIPFLFWLLLRSALELESQAQLATLLVISSTVFMFLVGYGYPFLLAFCL